MPYLRAWEMQEALEGSGARIQFRFREAETAPVIQPIGDVNAVQVDSVQAIHTLGAVGVEVVRANYPKPPTVSPIDPDVETMWRRFVAYQDGREPLLSMAYFCLTVVEGKSGAARDRRRAAATRYCVVVDVLDKLGQLTSEMGDELTARKSRVAHVPLTERERVWVEHAVRRICMQIARVEAGVAVEELSLAHLTPLR